MVAEVLCGGWNVTLMGGGNAMKRVAGWLAMLVVMADTVLASQPTSGGNDFVPASSLPAAEALPASSMVMVAYAFVWVALLAYVYYVWRRLQVVERELTDLERRAGARLE